ncbi:MAG: c-type cytochrome [Acidobacteriota bacterium]|jgi:tetratricopeptide (TPR) repeat protein
MRPTWKVAVLLMLFGGAPASAQLPEDFTNLKVLPKEIDARELTGIMRSYAGALGVRCWFCHVGEEGKPLSEFDFASDEKPEKGIAREMMKLVVEINARLAKVDLQHDPSLEVKCATCHHGLARPEPIGDILQARYDAGGIEAALARYAELHDEYYGRYAYDFGQGPLNMFAEALGRQGKHEDALTVQLKNAEYHPEADFVQFSLGEMYRRMGDEEQAATHYRRALELSPGNPFYTRALKQLEAD